MPKKYNRILLWWRSSAVMETTVIKDGEKKKSRQYKQWHHTWTCGRTNLNIHTHTHIYIWALNDQRESNRVRRKRMWTSAQVNHGYRRLAHVLSVVHLTILYVCMYVYRMRNIIMRLLVKVAVTRRQSNLSHNWK